MFALSTGGSSSNFTDEAYGFDVVSAVELHKSRYNELLAEPDDNLAGKQRERQVFTTEGDMHATI